MCFAPSLRYRYHSNPQPPSSPPVCDESPTSTSLTSQPSPSLCRVWELRRAAQCASVCTQCRRRLATTVGSAAEVRSRTRNLAVGGRNGVAPASGPGAGGAPRSAQETSTDSDLLARFLVDLMVRSALGAELRKTVMFYVFRSLVAVPLPLQSTTPINK